MKTIRHLNTLNTTTWIWLAVGLMATGWALEALHILVWPHYRVAAKVMEYLGTGVAWAGYACILALIPISAFRPENRFYLNGDCGLRAKRFGLVLAVNFAVFVLLVLTIASAISGTGFAI